MCQVNYSHLTLNCLEKSVIEMDDGCRKMDDVSEALLIGEMDDLRFYVPFQQYSVIPGHWMVMRL